MKNILTDRQQEILDFILYFKKESGYPPTLREIGKKFGISSTFGVKRHLDALVKKGYLNIESNASRGISVITESGSGIEKDFTMELEESLVRIPILGRVAAGNPVAALENYEGNLVVDPNFIKPSNDYFALKVKGDSMVNAGILEGDYVVVAVRTEINNNDIVVALIDEDATVKRFFKNNDEIKLLPENEKYSPIEVTENQSFSIAGVVVGVVRWF